jgi:ferritin-like metal-binding protein YciE
MPIKDPQEVFVMLLSNVRHSTERATNIYHQLSDAAENPEVKEALNARGFVSEKDLDTIDECFRIIGAKPMEFSGRLEDALVEDFRSKLDDIESPEARHLFVLAKASQLNHFRMGEYAVLIEAADAMEHYGVGLLLASCLADKIAFTERTRHLLRKIIAGKMAMRMAA